MTKLKLITLAAAALVTLVASAGAAAQQSAT